MSSRTNSKRPFKDGKHLTTPSDITLPAMRSNRNTSASSFFKEPVLSSTSSPSSKSAKNLVNLKEKLSVVDASSPAYTIDSRTNSLPFSQQTPRESNDKFNDSKDYEYNESMSMYSSGSVCKVDNSLYQDMRLMGGAQQRRKKVEKIVLSPSECKLQAAGLKFLDPKQQVNIIHLQLKEEDMNVNIDEECSLLRLLPNKKKQEAAQQRIKIKTRGTQTLYRESSAQTIPYLPGVSNDPAELETLEVFKLPTILPGDGPPGIYEVEVLERARKRWAFAKALKENFRKQLDEARKQVKLEQPPDILEAFEWEHWIEREEHIQECQMLRLEILIRMFDKREREMHTASQKRIEMSCEVIEAKRLKALEKNEIEHKRALRRLEVKRNNQPRVWRKEHISHGLGNPSSEFYAPKMRYGVNPNRRHYTALRKGFDMRMDDLEKKAVKMDYKHLKCPFAKLKEWSKPKTVLQEVEQNFCSDSNLKRLYENLATLRESSKKVKYAPICLKAKEVTKKTEEPKKPVQTVKQIIRIPDEDSASSARSSGYADQEQAMEDLRQQKLVERQKMEMLQREMRCEELETLISSFEGHSIGWLMRFLSEEMLRLKEQRKLHFYTMMAKRERWRREAAEAGLRQKENCMRKNYEKLYQECDVTNKEITKKFLKSILETDIKDNAEQKAEEYALHMARELDKEVADWLESFKAVQNPFNYQTLRYALRDIYIPNTEKLIYELERNDCIKYILGYIMCRTYKALEIYDISFTIASDFIDRLIDNDLYLNSPDCSSECECTDFCVCTRARQEAMAIIRKALRRAVPGRRWRTEEERIAYNNVTDLLDEVFDVVIPKESIIEMEMSSPPNVRTNPAHTDLTCEALDMTIPDVLDERISLELLRIKRLDTAYPGESCDVTKDLKPAENLLLLDPDKVSADRSLVRLDEYRAPEPVVEPETVRQIPSTHDIASVYEFKKMPIFAQTSSEELLQKLMEEVQVEEEDEIEEYMRIEEEIVEKYEDLIEEECEAVEEEERIENVEEAEHEKPEGKTIHFSAEPAKKVILEEPASIEDPSSADDKNMEGDNGVMEVLIVYDPSLNYSVAVPSGHDLISQSEEETQAEEEEEEE